MSPNIQNMNDEQAVRTLQIVVSGITDNKNFQENISTEVREAISQSGGEVFLGSSVSEGDLAREALNLLAADPELKSRIEAVAEAGGKPDTFDFGIAETVSVVALAICALQTSADISWDKENGLQIRIKKKAASESTIKRFLATLGSFIKKEL